MTKERVYKMDNKPTLKILFPDTKTIILRQENGDKTYEYRITAKSYTIFGNGKELMAVLHTEITELENVFAAIFNPAQDVLRDPNSYYLSSKLLKALINYCLINSATITIG